MKQEKIKYSDIMSLGFTEDIQNDSTYFSEFGFDYAIIERKLTKKIYLDWEKETQLCELVRMDHPDTCNIKKKKKVRDLEHLKEIIDFFTDKKDDASSCSYTYLP